MANELILIVEDNPNNLKLVRDSLQVKGYQTIAAETGEEGVRLAHERHPALILMDIQLPGISGVQALQQLRADPVTSSTPVIAITASVMTQDQTRIMAAGFDGRLPRQADQRQATADHGARDPRQAIKSPRCASHATPPEAEACWIRRPADWNWRGRRSSVISGYWERVLLNDLVGPDQ